MTELVPLTIFISSSGLCGIGSCNGISSRCAIYLSAISTRSLAPFSNSNQNVHLLSDYAHASLFSTSSSNMPNLALTLSLLSLIPKTKLSFIIKDEPSLLLPIKSLSILIKLLSQGKQYFELILTSPTFDPSISYS